MSMMTTKTKKKNDTKSAFPKNTLQLIAKAIKNVEPPPMMSVSEWADTYREIPSEYGADPGKWVSKDYQKPIMDAFTAKGVSKVVAMLGAQLGKSEILFNLLGRFIHLDPCPMLMVQPTVDDSKDFSKERLTPTVAHTPVLASRIHEQKSRNGDNTILKKLFPGGYLALVGSNAPSGLAKRSIRVLVCDEVDRFATSAGTEGDPVNLAEKRTSNFWNRIIGLFSTPTDAASRIYREYMLGSQEEWRYKCPNCGEWHWLTIDDFKFEYDEFEKDGQKSFEVHNVWWICPDCGFQYTEAEMRAAEQKYICLNPGVKSVRSFHVNAFTSPWVRWDTIIQEYLEAKQDEESMKTFVNTRLSEIYNPDSDIKDIDPLLARREEYTAMIPNGVLLLTAAVDVQDDRLEYEVAGWGRDEERWGIKKGILLGTPDSKSQVWQDLDSILDREYEFKDGRTLKIARTFIDSGGHYTHDVYEYCMKNQYRQRWAIKGAHEFGIPIIYKPAKTPNYPNLLLTFLGVNDGKEYVLHRLKNITKEGPMYMHFPVDENRGYDRRYFKGLLAEKLVLERKRGRVVKRWKNIAPDGRNEPIDLAVYNLACMKSLEPNWNEYEEIIMGSETSKKKEVKEPKYGCIREGIEV